MVKTRLVIDTFFMKLGTIGFSTHRAIYQSMLKTQLNIPWQVVHLSGQITILLSTVAGLVTAICRGYVERNVR